MEFSVDKFLSFRWERQSEDENTLHFTMRDGGKGLIDIDFFNHGEGISILEEIEVDSRFVKQLTTEIHDAVGIGDWLESLREPMVHIRHWSTSTELDKGLLAHDTLQSISKIGELFTEAIMYGYYASLLPTEALDDELKAKGDVVMMFDNRRLTQR